MSAKCPDGLIVRFLDLETTPNQGWAWGKYNQNLLGFTKRKELLSFAYSDLGSDKIACVTREGEKTDQRLVKRLHSLVQEADVLVAHNGDKFDHPIAKARFVYWKLPPTKILSTIDTKKAAYSFFRFDSNSLDDLAQYLQVGRKMPTPGFSLWEGCMSDDPKSWRTMVEYNKHDVKLLKLVYDRLRPWIQNHPSFGRLIDPYRHSLRCPYCASPDVVSRGYKDDKHGRCYRTTNTRTYRQWFCKACRGWFNTSINEKGKAR